MFCSNCGKQVADGARFCGHCGKPMNGKPAVAKPTVFSRASGSAREPIAVSSLASAASSTYLLLGVRLAVSILSLVQIVLYFVPLVSISDESIAAMVRRLYNYDNWSLLGILSGSPDMNFAVGTIIALGIIVLSFLTLAITQSREKSSVIVLSVVGILVELWNLLATKLLQNDIDTIVYRLGAYGVNAFSFAAVSWVMIGLTLIGIIVSLVFSLLKVKK